MPFFLYTREFSSTTPPVATNAELVRGDEVWDDWSWTYEQTGVVIRETGDVSALKAVFLGQRKRKVEELHQHVVFDRISFLPFADGTWRGALRDINDFRVMERGICLGLFHKGRRFEGLPCGLKNTSGY